MSLLLLRRNMWIKVAVILIPLVLSACGKKPSFVDPPEGKKADVFPRTYPAPVQPPFATSHRTSPADNP